MQVQTEITSGRGDVVNGKYSSDIVCSVRQVWRQIRWGGYGKEAEKMLFGEPIILGGKMWRKMLPGGAPQEVGGKSQTNAREFLEGKNDPTEPCAMGRCGERWTEDALGFYKQGSHQGPRKKQLLRWGEVGRNLISVVNVDKSDYRCLFDRLWVGIHKREARGQQWLKRVFWFFSLKKKSL